MTNQTKTPFGKRDKTAVKSDNALVYETMEQAKWKTTDDGFERVVGKNKLSLWTRFQLDDGRWEFHLSINGRFIGTHLDQRDGAEAKKSLLDLYERNDHCAVAWLKL